MTTAISFTEANSGLQVGTTSAPITVQFTGERPETPPEPCSNVPFSRDRDFIERGNLLDDIHERCSVENSRLALVGMGGVGKSQLAVEYCYRAREKSPQTWVFWVHSSNAARFEQGYDRIANQAKIPGRQSSGTVLLKSVLNWFQDTRRKWILVLDNVDDNGFLYEPRYFDKDEGGARMSLFDFLPRSVNGSIIMTTRSKKVAQRFVEDRDLIQIDPMSHANAQGLLKAKLGDQVKADNNDDVAKLAELLECLPLAIVQAAAYIKRQAPLCSVNQYIEEFEKSDSQRFKLLEYEAGHPRRHWEASNSVLITWQLSIDQIRANNPSAADLLSLMSFFDRHAIPGSLLHITAEAQFQVPAIVAQSVKESKIESSHSSERFSIHCFKKKVSNRLHKLRSTPRQTSVSSNNVDPVTLPNEKPQPKSPCSEVYNFQHDISILRDYSFVSVGRDPTLFEMHRLVQLATRKWLEANGMTDKWRQEFIGRLYKVLDDDEETKQHRMLCQSLLPHVELAMSQRPSVNELLSRWAELLALGAMHAQSIGNLWIMLSLTTTATNAMRQLYGADSEDTMAVTLLSGTAHLQLGHYTEAEALFQEVLNTSESTIGPQNPLRLSAIHDLACVYQWQGRLKEAETEGLKVIELRKKILGVENPITLLSMGNLALVYQLQGRWKEARMLGEEVLQVRKRILGEEHTDTIAAMSLLVMTYQSEGRFSEAQELAQNAVDVYKRTVGVEHPNYITAMNNLCVIYCSEGRDAEAQTLLNELLITSTKTLGPEHPVTLTTTDNLAHSHSRLNNWKEAIRLMENTMLVRRKIMGLEHYDTLKAMGNLSVLYGDHEQFSKAESLFLETFEAKKKVLGPEHPQTLITMYNLARFWKDAGRKPEAINLLNECVVIQERVLPKDHFLVPRFTQQLDSWLNESDIVDSAREGRYEDVERLLDEGADPTHRNASWGRTALSQAAEYDQTSVVTLLLERKVDPNITDVNGSNTTQNNTDKTPLMWASMRGHTETCRVLLEHGADPNFEGKDGETSLIWAAANDHKEVVQLLLSKGAAINHQGDQGRTPLSRAAANGHLAVVEFLLENGASNIPDNNGKDIAALASDAGHHDIVEKLSLAE
ncbi:uncharacterized protein N7483_012339 [Penicillium malachiteum]|uniref:uncharacterized protein n=1 Tax=Penicillium malachiteum TaxID=1324776 RepID=UPI00254897E2|nr:uncharacterized protein N7483_012339 [Penicillium malachiteum]KAJ5715158.1 hypothetical protein N7483_012339 [Penicillium malachiteum]